MGFGRYDMLINCENKRQLELLKESQLQWHEQNSDRSCSNRVILVILHMQLPQIWVTVMLERNVLQVYPASDRVVGSLHMAHTERRDAPGLPDFSLLKRLARDQLIFLLEQVTWPSTVSLNSPVSSEKDFAFWICFVNVNMHVLQLPGKKDLFIDADLMSPLDRIANVTILKVWNHVIHFRRKYWHAVFLND